MTRPQVDVFVIYSTYFSLSLCRLVRVLVLLVSVAVCHRVGEVVRFSRETSRINLPMEV